MLASSAAEPTKVERQRKKRKKDLLIVYYFERYFIRRMSVSVSTGEVPTVTYPLINYSPVKQEFIRRERNTCALKHNTTIAYRGCTILSLPDV